MSSEIDQIIEGAVAPAPTRPTALRMPQVSLLPTEIRSAARGRTTRIALAGVVVLALVGTAGATALVSIGATEAQLRLGAASARTQALSAQLAKFADVQKLDQTLAVERAAAEVGASTEVDWRRQIALIERDMPEDYRVVSITTDSATPLAIYGEVGSPLEMPRAATVEMTVEAQTITDLPEWLRRLRTIPTYADSTASLQNAEGGYSISLTVHLTSKAIDRLATTKGQDG